MDNPFDRTPINTRLAEFDPARSLVTLPDMRPERIAALAREMAINMRGPDVILRNFDLTPAQFEELKKTDFYKRAYDAYVIEWNSAISTRKRIEIEAASILEDALPVMGSKMLDVAQPLREQVEAGKLVAKICGVGEEKREALNPSERFVINISLGADTKLNYVKDVTPRKEIEQVTEEQ